MPKFADAARGALSDTTARRTLRRSAALAEARRARAVAEAADWEALREAGAAIRDNALRDLDRLLEEFEEAFTDAGGRVHWARDAAEATDIIADLVEAAREDQVLQASSPVIEEIGLTAALNATGITVHEADLAAMAAHLAEPGTGRRAASPASAATAAPIEPAMGGETEHIGPGHTANEPWPPYLGRAGVREILLRAKIGSPDLTDEPADLADAVRAHLREPLTQARVAVTGADFLVAETGTVVLAEQEGSGRRCAAAADIVISVAGVEQAVPAWTDLEVLLPLLARSAAGQPVSPVVSTWTGEAPARCHVVLVDNGRTRVLADEMGRPALRCIQCGACRAVCPVYERAGPVHPGPIGAALIPQKRGLDRPFEASLPYASTLCGACGDVCPVKIDIPQILVHLRGEVIESRRRRPVPTPELLMMRGLAWSMADQRRYEQTLLGRARWLRLLARGGRIRRLPGLFARWTDARDLPAPPKESFRVWWRRR